MGRVRVIAHGVGVPRRRGNVEFVVVREPSANKAGAVAGTEGGPWPARRVGCPLEGEQAGFGGRARHLLEMEVGEQVGDEA